MNSKIKLNLESYSIQKKTWPKEGHHILAQYDNNSIVVYQAYGALIGNFASQNGYFGGDFKLTRMTWIKTNFLWMMARSGWGTKPGQEVILAIRLKRCFFDNILANAVASRYDRHYYKSRVQWKKAIKFSEVRMQWDPDYDPFGQTVNRRAIQLGLRGQFIETFARNAILSIEDITSYTRDQYLRIKEEKELLLPLEKIYPVENTNVRVRQHLSE